MGLAYANGYPSLSFWATTGIRSFQQFRIVQKDKSNKLHKSPATDVKKFTALKLAELGKRKLTHVCVCVCVRARVCVCAVRNPL
jgi:hypothetical protein